MPLTLCWPAPPKPGRTLFVALAYHGADRDAQTRGILERIESPSARGHRIVHRDHYANPRALPYLISMIGEAAGLLSPQAPPDLVVDRRYEHALPEDVAKRFGRVTVAALAGPRDAGDDAWMSAGYDHVVLVYPDALGLGCEAAEKRVLAGRSSVFVINGRRRLFIVRRGINLRLRLSRFLAHTRVVERACAWLVGPFGAALAAWDRAAGRAND